MSANRGARIILHSLERSRSQRIIWLLEELNLTYEIRPYKRGVNERAPPELKSIHPIGKAPILSIYPKGNGNNNGQSTVRSSGGNTDSDRSPCTLAESAVIMEHLLEHFHRPQEKRLTPIRWVDGQENQVGGETDAWLRYRYYMHYTEGSLMPLVVTNILMDVVKSAPPFFLKPLVGIVPSIVKKEYCRPNFNAHLGFLENQLVTSKNVGQEKPQDQCLAGTFTAADILASYPLIILKEVKVLERDGYPALWDYVERMKEMQGYRKAVKVLEEVEGQAYRPF